MQPGCGDVFFVWFDVLDGSSCGHAVDLLGFAHSGVSS